MLRAEGWAPEKGEGFKVPEYLAAFALGMGRDSTGLERFVHEVTSVLICVKVWAQGSAPLKH